LITPAFCNVLVCISNAGKGMKFAF
jgi:hypothetical protein